MIFDYRVGEKTPKKRYYVIKMWLWSLAMALFGGSQNEQHLAKQCKKIKQTTYKRSPFYLIFFPHVSFWRKVTLRDPRLRFFPAGLRVTRKTTPRSRSIRKSIPRSSYPSAFLFVIFVTDDVYRRLIRPGYGQGRHKIKTGKTASRGTSGIYQVFQY